MKVTFRCAACGYDNDITLPFWLTENSPYDTRCLRCGQGFTIRVGNTVSPLPAAATPTPIGLVDLPALYDEIALHLRRNTG